jgi:3-oxoadipate enol-lactonase
VLNWDVRGHGLSQPLGGAFSLKGCAEDLLAILDEAGYQQAVFVGLSMGGNIAQELVFAHPERVTALVLLDCACNTLQLSGWEKALVWISVPMLRMYPAGMLRRQIANTSSLKPEVRRYIEDACSTVVSNADFMAVWVAVTDCLHEEKGYHISKPLLLAHGDHDNLGNIKRAMPRWAQRDHARYVVVPDAGHTSNQDNPTFVNRILSEFLREVTQ